MKDNTSIGLNETEEAALTYEISDEALERTADREIAGNYTLANCTGLSVCPG
jgi:hypothetical protein